MGLREDGVGVEVRWRGVEGGDGEYYGGVSAVLQAFTHKHYRKGQTLSIVSLIFM
jgi:hypothetical protein